MRLFFLQAKNLNLLLYAAVFSFAESAKSLELNTWVNGTSDYVFRGLSQTNGNPALQLMPKLSSENGLHTLAFISPVDFGQGSSATLEYDFAVGFEKSAENFSWGSRLLRFNYRGQSALNSTELRCFGTYELLDVTYGHIFDTAHTGTSGNHLEVGLSHSVSRSYTARVQVGHSFFSENDFYEDYYHTKLSLSWNLNKTNLELAYNNTWKGNYGDSAGERVILSVAHTF